MQSKLVNDNIFMVFRKALLFLQIIHLICSGNF